MLYTKIKQILYRTLTLFRIGAGAKRPPPPTHFFPGTSTNVGISPKNFLTFSFNAFATLEQNFKLVSNASPNLLNLNEDYSLKKTLFLL